MIYGDINPKWKVNMEEGPILEAAVQADTALLLIFQHMIKYVCNPTKQSSSWVKTIVRCYNDLHDKKNKKASFSDSELDDIYSMAIIAAENEGNDIPEWMLVRDKSWSYDNIKNRSWLNYFLKSNYYENNRYDLDLNKYIIKMK